MTVLRRITALFVSVEMLFGMLFSGGIGAKITMPQTGAGTYTKYADPFIGTGGIPWATAMLSPAATAPFGCVRLGPDTSAAGGIHLFKTNTSGYYYEHRHMLGFSMGRLSGTGIYDYGMFRVTPFCGRNNVSVLGFSHENEVASPGYYAVYLPGASVLCEMTATAHTGYQRYTFSTSQDAKLFIDASSHAAEGESKDAEIEFSSDRKSFTAQVTELGGFSSRYGGLKIYAYGEIDTPVKSVTDTGSGLELNFGSVRDNPVCLRMGISFVSVENAKENLYAETKENDFDDVKDDVRGEWESRLSAIKITASENVKRIFYTALYHTMIMPTDFTDSDGTYVGFDKQTYTAEGFTYRTDMSLWDTCRNTHSLYTLIAPDVQSDCLRSLMLMAQQGGVLPRWPMGEGYTGSMHGSPANIVLTESYLKGFRDFDGEKALEYMIKSAETFNNKENREYAEYIDEYGYIPDDIVRTMYRGTSVSRMIEYSWDDAAIAVLAEELGHEDIAEKYAARSMLYKNVWNSETKYFQARNADGSWGVLKPDMTAFYDDVLGFTFSKAYCEGSARQWRWGALHDIDSLPELFGSNEYFVSELEDFMKDASSSRAAFNPGSGFWVGNQHDIHTPYLFNVADRPDLTQKWVRWTLENRFSTDIDGLDGNDDGGTLSAWYVFSALGFYPIAGSDMYWLGSPCIDSAELDLGNGKTLKVTAKNQGSENVCVSSVTFDGTPLDGTKFSHSLIENGGELVFNMEK